MSIEHKNITDPNIHEPKGVGTAAVNTAYVATGAGTGTWRKLPVQSLAGIVGDGTSGQSVVSDGAGSFALRWIIAYGQVSFANLAGPTVITYPSSYTKVMVATTASGSSREVDESVASRLTYIGSGARVGKLLSQLSLGHTAVGAVDVQLAIYKNGVLIPRAETLCTITNAQKKQISLSTQISVVTNDYFEIFVKNNGASGDVNVHALSIEFEAA